MADVLLELQQKVAMRPTLEVKLTQCGHNSWKWSEEGNNHGKTMKIKDHWYYFEASF